jgi:hypothetical protein
MKPNNKLHSAVSVFTIAAMIVGFFYFEQSQPVEAQAFSETYDCSDSNLTCKLNDQLVDRLRSFGIIDVSDGNTFSGAEVTLSCSVNASTMNVNFDISGIDSDVMNYLYNIHDQGDHASPPYNRASRIYFLDRSLSNTWPGEEINGLVDNEYREFWMHITRTIEAMNSNSYEDVEHLNKMSPEWWDLAQALYDVYFEVDGRAPYDTVFETQFNLEIPIDSNRVNLVSRVLTEQSSLDNANGAEELMSALYADLRIPTYACEPQEQFEFDVAPDTLTVAPGANFEYVATANPDSAFYGENSIYSEYVLERQAFSAGAITASNGQRANITSHRPGAGLPEGRHQRCSGGGCVEVLNLPESGPYVTEELGNYVYNNYSGLPKSDFHSNAVIKGTAPTIAGTYFIDVETQNFVTDHSSKEVDYGFESEYSYRNIIRQLSLEPDTNNPEFNPSFRNRSGTERVTLIVDPTAGETIPVTVHCSALDPELEFRVFSVDGLDNATANCGQSPFRLIPTQQNPFIYENGRQVGMMITSSRESNKYQAFSDNLGDGNEGMINTIASQLTAVKNSNGDIEEMIFRIHTWRDLPEVDLIVSRSNGGPAIDPDTELQPGETIWVEWSSTNADQCRGSWTDGLVTMSSTEPIPVTVPDNKVIEIECNQNEIWNS